MLKHHIFIIFCLLSIIGCTSNANDDPLNQKSVTYSFPELEEVTSIRNLDVDSWTSIDKRSLIVNASPSRSYLIILTRPNYALRFAHAISFGHNNRIHSKFDRLHIINNQQDIHPEQSLIQRIYKITSKEQKQIIIRAITQKVTTTP